MMRKLALTLGTSLLAGSIGLAGGAPVALGGRSATFSGNDDANLHLVHSSGASLLEQGPATGSLPGTITANLKVGATFSGTFTISTRNGKIFGHGSARPHAGSGAIESFAGTVTITGGTGRYRTAHGTGGLYGTFNRRSYAVVLQTRGTMHY